MIPAVKLEFVRMTKSKFKAMYARMQPSLPKELPAQRLPGSWQEFKIASPQWFAFAFGEVLPVPQQVSNVDLHEIMCTTPMRQSRHDVCAPAAQQPGRNSPELQCMQMMQGLMMQLVGATGHVGGGSSSSTQLPGLQILQQPQRSPSEGRFLKRFSTRLAITDVGREPAGKDPMEESAQHEPPVEQHIQAASDHQSTVPESAAPSTKLGPMAAAAAVSSALREKHDSTKATSKALPKAKAATKGAKAKARPKAKAAAKAQPKAKVAGKFIKPTKNPSISMERSRNQILGRTGLQGLGQTKTFRFATHGNEQGAWKEAEKWLKKEQKKRGIV